MLYKKTKINFVRSKVLTAAFMKMAVSCVVAPCSLIKANVSEVLNSSIFRAQYLRIHPSSSEVYVVQACICDLISEV